MNAQKFQPMQVGSGAKIHLARKTTSKHGIDPYGTALCGMKPNRNADYVRINLPYPDGTPVTCDKCLAALAKQAA